MPKSPAPLTSILTCTYNMKHFLPSAIKSVFRQTDSDFELLVLDDGSTDGTWDYLQQFNNVPFMRLFRSPTRAGMAESRKTLLAQSRGAFLSILDADDTLVPTKVEWHRKILEKEPEAGVVWGRAIVFRMREGHPAWGVLPEFGFRPGWDIASPYKVVHSATTWRKAAVLKAGGYRPWNGNEPVDLYFRVGDFSAQRFDEKIASVCLLSAEREHRAFYGKFGGLYSKRLLLSTLRRRYGLSAGSLYDRLSAHGAEEG